MSVKASVQPSTTRRSIWDASLLEHLLRTVVICVSLYTIFIVSLMFGPVQRAVVFLHHVRWPLFPKYDTPEAYGFAPNRVRNFYIEAEDGIRLGAWHVLPQSISDEYDIDAQIPDSAFDAALTRRDHPVFLYFHGNAASRLTGHRIHLARHISSLGLDMNFVAIDYRGFGDSSKIAPSEAGLISDARATWDWLTLDKDVSASQIIIAGQSLGTGVATALAGLSLHQDNIVPRALILTAPFSSIPSVLLTYKLVQIIPIMQPFNYFTSVRKYLIRFLQTHFDTQTAIQNVKCPVLLIHSLNDAEVVSQHSRDIFDAVLIAEQESGAHIAVNSTSIADFGTLRSFAREGALQPNGRPVMVHLETKYGGHNDVGYGETSLRAMREIVRNGYR